MNLHNYNRVIEQIEKHPETWDQELYHSACGTTHCFAGIAQILSDKPLCMNTIQKDARQYLELFKGEAVYLFAPQRTLKELKEYPQKNVLEHQRTFFSPDGFDIDGLDANFQTRPKV